MVTKAIFSQIEDGIVHFSNVASRNLSFQQRFPGFFFEWQVLLLNLLVNSLKSSNLTSKEITFYNNYSRLYLHCLWTATVQFFEAYSRF